MIRLKTPVIVEGKYDKIRLSNIIDAPIFTTDGFRIFKDKDKQEMLRSLASRRGIVIFTDSDGAGFVIRNFLKGIVEPRYIKNAYIPDIEGKEKRKRTPSKEGKLGVEGMSPEIIISALVATPFSRSEFHFTSTFCCKIVKHIANALYSHFIISITRIPTIKASYNIP